jgi:esterase/lipase superfamily enzyme
MKDIIVVVGAWLLAMAQVASADSVGSAERCQAAKVRAFGSYHLCSSRAEAQAVSRGTTPDPSGCLKSFSESWQRAEDIGGDSCPTTNDEALILGELTRQTTTASAALEGSGLESSNCIPSGIPFAYSYMVTNRSHPFATLRREVKPGAPGDLHFFTADGPYEANDVTTNYEEVSSETFFSRLKTDLALTESGGALQLGLHVHGLGNLFHTALKANAQFGCRLAKDGGYPGLIIGFSWPSYDAHNSLLFYATEPPPAPALTPQRMGSTRDNILGSRTSFKSLLEAIQTEVVTALADPVDFSLLTHSEGNYMGMVGLSALDTRVSLKQCLMMAADISAVSLQTNQQGQAIADTCEGVTVYYSGADAQLATSGYEYFRFHLADFPIRLGSIGPFYAYPAPLALNPNVIGVDSSSVTVAPAVSNILNIHPSYRFIPEILKDLTETMLGEAQSNRSPIPGTTQGFVLKEQAR